MAGPALWPVSSLFRLPVKTAHISNREDAVLTNREQIQARIERDKARKAKKRYERAHGIFRANDGIDLELLSEALNDAAFRCKWCWKSIPLQIAAGLMKKTNYSYRRIQKLNREISAEERVSKITPYGEFPSVFTIRNLIKSLQKRRRGVEWKGNVQRFIFHSIVRIKRIKKDLLSGKLSVDDTIRKIILHERGKRREIHAVMIDCRVVQGCFCDSSLIPLTEYRLIRDNPASVKGKGISDARDRISSFLLRLAQKYKSNFYVMTSDYKGFFDSIQHRQCLSVFREAYLDRMLQGLGMKIAKMYKESELAEIKDPVNRQKEAELLKSNMGVGVTLGSQESQIMALAVPSRIDHAIKDTLGIHEFVRYMDDTMSAGRTKEMLLKVFHVISKESQKIWLNTS